MHYLKEATIWINHYWSKAFEELFKARNSRYVPDGDAPPPRLHKSLVLSKEEICTSKDYTIQRFLLRLKLFQGVLQGPFIDEADHAQDK